MTKVKICGLKREEDIAFANELRPDYIGFVFAKASKRYVDREQAAALKGQLSSEIKSVGVFVDETAENVAELLNSGIIDLAQLHGSEDEKYIEGLRALTDKPIIQAFKIKTAEDISRALESTADYILLDSGAGSGEIFDWNLLKDIDRPWFLAGGLSAGNVREAVDEFHPYGVDVSSAVETGEVKDKGKMAAFIAAVR